ncbi:hypothetical protein PDIDSM_8112 [Penicillium digitatum]|nr:hypothetical protein PDIDSM_8112 [Penicillium digitatum]
MAHQATDNNSESWNPALRPENNNSSATMSLIQGGLSDLIAADEPKDESLEDIVSPQSEDFSAWDISDEVDAIQPKHTSLDVLVNNASPVIDQVVYLDTDSIEKKSQTPDRTVEAIHTKIAPSIENADTVLSPTPPETQPAQPVQTQAPSVQSGAEASNGGFTTVEGSAPVQTETFDIFVPTVAPEQEYLEPTFVRDATPSGEERTMAPEPMLDTLKHEFSPQSTPSEKASLQTDEGNTDSEDPSATFEKDLGNAPPPTEEATPHSKISHNFSEFASTPNLIQDREEPKFVEEAVRPSPEETAFTGATFDEKSADIFNYTEKVIATTEIEQADLLSRSINVESENADSSVPMEAFASTNEAYPDPAAADEDTAPQDQPFWTNEASGKVDSDEDDFFNQLNSQTKPIFAPPEAEPGSPEAEPMFEEGAPLLDKPTTASPQRRLEEDKSIDSVFTNDEDDADRFFSSAPKLEDKNGDENFLGSTSKEDAEEQPVDHFARNSTSQVLESAGFVLDSPVSDSSAAAQFDDALKVALLEPQTTVDPSEEELAARWEAELADSPDDDLAARWEAALDDDDILLEAEAAQSVSAQEQINQTPIQSTHNGLSAGLNSPFQTPQAFPQPRPVPNIYTPHQPSTGDLLQGVPLAGTLPPATGAMSSYFSQAPHNPVAIRGESFAERSKQGYKSPYDLPDEISRPRKPVTTHKPVPPTVTSLPPPPPRGLSGVPIPAAAGFLTPAAPPSSVSAPPAPKNFYEELPWGPPRSRPASSGRYTPNPQAVPTMTGSSLSLPQVQYAAAAPPVPQHMALPIQSTFQPPEQLDPYASLASSALTGPSADARYSPQPPGLQAPPKPPSLPRYSPAPPPTSSTPNRYASQPLNVPGQNLPFQPRTSSPLAHHEKVSYQPDQSHKLPSLDPAINLSPTRGQGAGFGQIPPSAPQYLNGPDSLPRREGAGSPVQSSPPQSRYAPQEYLNEFAQRLAPAPEHALPVPATNVYMSPPPNDIQIGPLRRSQTQSPSRDLTSPRSYGQNIDILQRPASVQLSGSPTRTVNPYASVQAVSQTRAPTKHLEFIVPNDGHQHDPLERWKGAPIFKFGFGGSIASCFPRYIPRYSAGQVAPMIQPTLGEPKISQLNEWLPSGNNIVQHPGPLKAKSKKKDLIAWLSNKISAFEASDLPSYEQVQSDTRKRQEEKILLWKVVKLLVENDGNLESSPEIQNSLRQIIFPNLPNPDADGSYTNSLAASGGFAPSEMPSQPDAVDPQWLEELRLHLIYGDREKAVWSAVDRRLWGHAMIISSTMDRSISKQVAQEFVRREVRSKSTNTESLAALYEIFAGNIEESIDELVPPSARAGLQLISKADGQGSTKNALEGLDKWRDTLGLVLSNRSSEDHLALFSLGHLLNSYGRTDAAHVCYIFSRAAVFGGPDDPKANITLLGADHQRCPSSLMEGDAVLLTEAYEYATSVLSNSPTAHLPHLLAFKILNARRLVDQGRNLEAQGYCDAVAAALKATTRPSPYYHQHLFAEVEELSARLRQTTSDSGSWISRPSMEKVSGSMWARFNSFVVGDDNDAASTGSGKGGEHAEVGPFANVAGTPTISRSPSVSDIYGSYPGATAGAQPIPTSGVSKYHPSGQYAPNASPEQFKGRSSMDSQRSASYFPPVGQRRSSQELSPSIDQQMSYGASLYTSSYIPLAPVEEAMSPSEALTAAQPMVNGLFYQPPGQAATSSESPYYQGPPGMPAGVPDSDSPYAPPVASSSYEPVSYEPVSAGVDTGDVAQEDDVPPVAEQSKKQAIMDDDDDDLAARAAAIQRAENDRKANEAFAKAAEEDAKKDAQQSGKKGWFGGWFGGAKKEENNSGGGPIRAKLGEKSSFYYDKDLKKWVNKKDPGSGAPVHSTPPPPRGSAPPSRTASSGSIPPNGAPPMPPMSVSGSRPQSSLTAAPPSLSSSPGFSGLAPRSVSTGAAMPTPPGISSGPPPRPSSSLTHANSIDDLIGAPQARKGNTVRGKKKGRYVDVMAQ